MTLTFINSKINAHTYIREDEFMDTIIEKITGDAAKDNAILERAAQIIKKGGLVAFPTETVYGLGGDAFDADAARKIYAAKGRPSDNPLIVHIAHVEELKDLSDNIPKMAYRVADKFWPGPLTMIVQKNDRVPSTVTGGLDTVAVRLPSNETARRFGNIYRCSERQSFRQTQPYQGFSCNRGFSRQDRHDNRWRRYRNRTGIDNSGSYGRSSGYFKTGICYR